MVNAAKRQLDELAQIAAGLLREGGSTSDQGAHERADVGPNVCRPESGAIALDPSCHGI
jgi:hypothetical protein